MDCSCIYVDQSDGDTPSLFNRKIRVSKKAHMCSECRGEITKGEKYEYVVGVWSGEFAAFKICSPCLEIRNELFCDGYSLLGNMWEDIREYSELSIAELDKFSVAAQIKLCEML